MIIVSGDSFGVLNFLNRFKKNTDINWEMVKTNLFKRARKNKKNPKYVWKKSTASSLWVSKNQKSTSTCHEHVSFDV